MQPVRGEPVNLTTRQTAVARKGRQKLYSRAAVSLTLDSRPARSAPPLNNAATSNQTEELIVVPAPPGYSAEEAEAWAEVVKISQLSQIRKLPVHYKVTCSIQQQDVWDPAREALKKAKKAAKQKNRRVTKASPPQHGHIQDEEFRAAANIEGNSDSGGKAFTANERARLVHCLAAPEMRPYIAFILRGATFRVDIDKKKRKLQPFSALANPDSTFNNHFIDNLSGDDDLRRIDPAQ
mmetsp:Transcript_21720/g.60397  ORF Transcript_21720/g.60397 Transcript_21720/m.60397 type:complete len:237 (-) Transcript_21720:324-1034(-)